MKKQINNLNQEVFDFFQPINKWPEGYRDKLMWPDGHGYTWGMDLETEGLDPYDTNRRVISFAVSPTSYVAWSSYTLNMIDEKDIKKFRLILQNPSQIIVGHNIKYDINWIRIKFGIDVKCMLFDTMFAQYLID